MSERRNWTREELILAFNLYCKIPFGQYNQRNSKVIELANLIGRSPSAVAFKLGNFASFDPYHQARGVSGLKNAGKLDKEIYEEFSNNWEDLIFESEVLLRKKLKNKKTFELDNYASNAKKKKGVEKNRLVKTRVNQYFFRIVVLTNYENKCAVSNIDLPELLIASHIIPWSMNKKERLNPSNGICLSPLYDKVFDKGLMTIQDDFKIKFSTKLYDINDKTSYAKFFGEFENKQINLPSKFIPDLDFLSFHQKNIFQP